MPVPDGIRGRKQPGAPERPLRFVQVGVPDRVVLGADGRIAWVVGHEVAEPFKLTGSERRVVHLRARRMA